MAHVAFVACRAMGQLGTDLHEGGPAYLEVLLSLPPSEVLGTSHCFRLWFQSSSRSSAGKTILYVSQVVHVTFRLTDHWTELEEEPFQCLGHAALSFHAEELLKDGET